MTMQDEHCKDCCCARAWKALRITGYTGKSIPEHIEDKEREIEVLRKGLHFYAYEVSSFEAPYFDRNVAIEALAEADKVRG